MNPYINMDMTILTSFFNFNYCNNPIANIVSISTILIKKRWCCPWDLNAESPHLIRPELMVLTILWMKLVDPISRDCGLSSSWRQNERLSLSLISRIKDDSHKSVVLKIIKIQITAATQLSATATCIKHTLFEKALI